MLRPKLWKHFLSEFGLIFKLTPAETRTAPPCQQPFGSNYLAQFSRWMKIHGNRWLNGIDEAPQQNIMLSSTSSSKTCFLEVLRDLLIKRHHWSERRGARNQGSLILMKFMQTEWTHQISVNLYVWKKSCWKHSLSRFCLISALSPIRSISMRFAFTLYKNNTKWTNSEQSCLENSRIQCSSCHRTNGFCTFRSRPYRQFNHARIAFMRV